MVIIELKVPENKTLDFNDKNAIPPLKTYRT